MAATRQSKVQPNRMMSSPNGGATATARMLAKPQYPIPSARRPEGIMSLMRAAEAARSADQKAPCGRAVRRISASERVEA